MKVGKSLGFKKIGIGAIIILFLAIIGGNETQTQQNVAPPAKSSEDNVSEIKLTPTQDIAEPEPAPETTNDTEPAQEVEPVRASTPTPQPKNNCDPNYTPCIPNVSYDLDCADVGFSVTVIGDDVHGLDGNDNDGLGCESY